MLTRSSLEKTIAFVEQQYHAVPDSYDRLYKSRTYDPRSLASAIGLTQASREDLRDLDNFALHYDMQMRFREGKEQDIRTQYSYANSNIWKGAVKNLAGWAGFGGFIGLFAQHPLYGIATGLVVSAGNRLLDVRKQRNLRKKLTLSLEDAVVAHHVKYDQLRENLMQGYLRDAAARMKERQIVLLSPFFEQGKTI